MSNRVRFTGWNRGLRKISLTDLLQRETDLSAADAKRIVDDILENRSAEVIAKPDQADRLVAEARTLGAICEVID